MQMLDVFKGRKYSVVRFAQPGFFNRVVGKKTEYKIPNEYTVEEAERLLELGALQEALEAETVEPATQEKQLARHTEIVFNRLEIIFQHYQPEMTAESLKTIVTHNEALEILGFFQKHRQQAIRDIISGKDTDEKSESKKKSKLASTELRELRRSIAFMVVHGFSLFDLRKLYIDELYDFHQELIYSLEKMGKIKEGSYAKIKKADKSVSKVDDTVSELRRQMFQSIADRKRK